MINIFSKNEKQSRKLQKIIEKSGFFDKTYYLKIYRDARLADMTPIEHYCKIGIKEDRKPNADFDPVWYREYYEDVKADGGYPFLHYILFGRKENRFQNETEKNSIGRCKRYKGSIDYLGREIARGWAWCPDYPEHSFFIEAILNNEVIGRGRANIFRKDLFEHNVGTGYYGFEIKFDYILNGGDIPELRLNFSDDLIMKNDNNMPQKDTIEIVHENKNKEYVEYIEHDPLDTKLKTIAFYLPQFHPFPENDAWWGKGFTEWTNVTKAKPNFVGHYQPHLPIHNGFYDLRVPEVMIEQAKLARNYGIYGFSFYYYWFDGKILMHRPFEILLEHKEIDINFCITWANENWTRRWDGLENEVLIAQNHSEEDSIKFIHSLFKYFKDERYIRIDNKPVLIIYRSSIIPEIKKTGEIWRKEIKKAGFEGLYLICAQTTGTYNPDDIGFDAAVEFPPHTTHNEIYSKELQIINPNFKGTVIDYDIVVKMALKKQEPQFKLFKTSTLSWDNTARRQNNATIFHNFSIEAYKNWMIHLYKTTLNNEKYSDDEKLVFVNAWNEWAEGTHLEPDREYGYAYLEATYDALKKSDPLITKSNYYDIVILSTANQQNSYEHLLELLEWFKSKTYLRIGVVLEGEIKDTAKLQALCKLILIENIEMQINEIKKYFDNKIKSFYVHSLDNIFVLKQMKNLHVPTICNIDNLNNLDFFEENIIYFSRKKQIQNPVVKNLSNDDLFELSLLELLYDFTDLNPKVSVIVPSYNHEPFLKQRLDSIFNQTFQDFEIILLDDASKDNSRQVLAEYAEKRPSTSISLNTTNSGTPFSQWAKGMKAARAEIIWIAEDDDFCEKNFLERLIPLFFNKRIKMAYANSHLVDENNNPIGKYEDIFSKISIKKWNQNYITHAYEEVYESLAIRNTIPNASAVLFRKFDIENILEELKTFKFAGDWYFYLNILSSGGDIGYISDKLNYHRRHTASTMSILKDDLKLYFGEIEKIHRFVRNNFLLTDVVIDKTIEYIQDEWINKQCNNKRLDEYYDIEDLSNSKKSIKRIQNIAVFFSGYYFGGAEVFPINLANAFAEMGHNTYLFNVGALETDARVEAMVSPLVNKVDIIGSTNSVADLKKFLIEHNIEFINSQGWIATDFLQKNLEDCAIPWFVSMHGHEENIIEGGWGEEYLQYFELAMKNTISKTPKFIYTHEKNLEVFDHFPINKKCKLIEIPTLGMDATLPESKLKSELNIDKDSFVLGFVARGIEEKGWIEVIEATKILHENYKLKVDLVLIGDSEFVQTLKSQNKNFNYIHFLGYSDEVLSWCQIFDVSLLPSFYKSESHPLVIMGYLLCSSPVITTPLGNIPEMIKYNGEHAGYLLQFTQEYRTDPKEIAEVISNYINNPLLYKRHRALARKAFEKFDMKAAASKYVEVFNQYSKV